MCCSIVSNSVTPWTVAHQVLLYMRFPRPEYWSGLPFSFSGGSSLARDWTWVFCIFYICRRILYHWDTWEASSLPLYLDKSCRGKNVGIGSQEQWLNLLHGWEWDLGDTVGCLSVIRKGTLMKGIRVCYVDITARGITEWKGRQRINSFPFAYGLMTTSSYIHWVADIK